MITWHKPPPALCARLPLVGVWVPLLHDGVVEVLVGEEAGPQHHGEADGQHRAHHAAIITQLGINPLIYIYMEMQFVGCNT